MFFQRDYVLRMIEMMGDLVRNILSIAREVDARGELDAIAGRACGMPMSMLRAQPPEALAELLDDPQRFLAAELLMIDIEISRRTHTEDTLIPDKEQAIRLYATLRDPDYLLPAADRVSGMLEEMLADAAEDTLLAAAGLLEEAGQFAAAEDALFAAAERNPAHLPAAHALYDRLDGVSENALLSGGLSREEIAEGRAALLALAPRSCEN